jgi:hypothetical protein
VTRSAFSEVIMNDTHLIQVTQNKNIIVHYGSLIATNLNCPEVVIYQTYVDVQAAIFLRTNRVV